MLSTLVACRPAQRPLFEEDGDARGDGVQWVRQVDQTRAQLSAAVEKTKDPSSSVNRPRNVHQKSG